MSNAFKSKKISDIIKENPEAREILANEGLFCADCPFAQYETIEEGSAVHGLKSEEIIQKLQSAQLAKQKKSSAAKKA